MARILIVEDEGLVAQDIAATLRTQGHDVAPPATNGPDALATAQATPPDIVLLDIHLRGPLDGIETARRIRETAPRPPRIIFLTGSSDDTTRRRATEAHADAYLLKPFDETELTHALHAALTHPQGAQDVKSGKAESGAGPESSP